MDSRFTLEKRIQAELASYDGKMCLYADDFHGNIICLGADEKVETARYSSRESFGTSLCDILAKLDIK